MNLKKIFDSMSESDIPESRIKKFLRNLTTYITEGDLATFKDELASGRTQVGYQDGSRTPMWFEEVTDNSFVIYLSYQQARAKFVVNDWQNKSYDEIIDELTRQVNYLLNNNKY